MGYTELSDHDRKVLLQAIEASDRLYVRGVQVGAYEGSQAWPLRISPRP